MNNPIWWKRKSLSDPACKYANGTKIIKKSKNAKKVFTIFENWWSANETESYIVYKIIPETGKPVCVKESDIEAKYRIVE